MTIYIPFWAVYIIIPVTGFIIACWIGSKTEPTSGFIPDFVTPMIALAVFIFFVLFTLGVAIGRWAS